MKILHILYSFSHTKSSIYEPSNVLCVDIIAWKYRLDSDFFFFRVQGVDIFCLLICLLCVYVCVCVVNGIIKMLFEKFCFSTILIIKIFHDLRKKQNLKYLLRNPSHYSPPLHPTTSDHTRIECKHDPSSEKKNRWNLFQKSEI